MASVGQCAFGTAVTTLFHPIAYAKVLIQVVFFVYFLANKYHKKLCTPTS